MLADLIESKQTKACPDGLKGFRVSLSSFSSKWSFFILKLCGSLYLDGMQQLKYASPVESWALMSIERSFRS